MWRRFIEERERKSYQRDSNRKSLPFEWGAEHIGIHANGNARSALLEYSQRAVLESDVFYSYSPTADYKFDGEILRFPSGLETAYAENNIVWGRLFEASSKDLAVIVLPQWNCKWEGQIQLCRVLRYFGVTALRLSLPYHHHRKPSHLERAEYLVSANIGRTLSAIRQSVLDTRRAADWLLSRGYKRIGLVGTSVGSCIAFLTFAHDDRFSCGAFIHASSFFADVVWQGLSTTHVCRSLHDAIDLEELRTLWSPISPYPFIKRLRGTDRRMLLLAGRYDTTFLPELSQLGFDEFVRHQIPHKQIWIPCGHYSMGEFPFREFVGYQVVRFLMHK